MGLEPTNAGTTIRSLNHLATPAMPIAFLRREKFYHDDGTHVCLKIALQFLLAASGDTVANLKNLGCKRALIYSAGALRT